MALAPLTCKATSTAGKTQAAAARRALPGGPHARESKAAPPDFTGKGGAAEQDGGCHESTKTERRGAAFSPVIISVSSVSLWLLSS